MEADWEVEVGAGAPVIDALWPGFADLRLAPERASALPEAADLPALADALVALNAPASPVWTAKCDLWPVDAFDPDELDAPREDGLRAIACYIDLLPGAGLHWREPEEAVNWCRSICGRIRAIPLRCSRVDLVVRSASVAPEKLEYGVTAYLTAAGADLAVASQVLSAALAAFADTVCPSLLPIHGDQSYNEDVGE
ncbi:MAG: hypothetical protein KGM96_06360 [Acidobacteriota bacterium]|nr:hypothetical protein [Acidobacteriota bacterium]